MMYLIKEGKHSAKGIHIGLTFKRELKFEASFNSSCLYSFGDNDIYDVNKLFGFSTTWFHHKQSARFGWRCLDGKNIEILTYTYNKGKRQKPELIGSIKPGQKLVGSIYDHPDCFLFEMEINGNHTAKLIEKDNLNWPFRYFLYPYFGGNKPAPHDMLLNMDRKKGFTSLIQIMS